MTTPTADIGLIGLAVMGQNLVLNMNDHGFVVAVYNRTVSKVDEFLAHEANGTQVIGAHSIEELAGLLKRPRRVMLMVKAGSAVDDFIELLIPHMEPGDIIIDGGNSNYEDSIRRTRARTGGGCRERRPLGDVHDPRRARQRRDPAQRRSRASGGRGRSCYHHELRLAVVRGDYDTSAHRGSDRRGQPNQESHALRRVVHVTEHEVDSHTGITFALHHRKGIISATSRNRV